MKVVIFCGGLGVRMGEETKRIPKPMITIGGKPILWHIMDYYASWGHTEFILCLGYKGEVIKEYFLSYNEALFNDFVLEHDGRGSTVELLSPERPKWRITSLPLQSVWPERRVIPTPLGPRQLKSWWRK